MEAKYFGNANSYASHQWQPPSESNVTSVDASVIRSSSAPELVTLGHETLPLWRGIILYQRGKDRTSRKM